VSRRHRPLLLGLLALALGGAAPGADARTDAPPAGPRVLFADHFNGHRVDPRRWVVYDSPGNGGHGVRRPSAIRLDGRGHLVITARMRRGVLVSGGMASRLDVDHGRIEFRVRTDPDPTGTTSGVVLMWPRSENWPADGETDIYETGAFPGTRSPFGSFVHYGAANRQQAYVQRADGARWHRMALQWSRDALEVFRDGRRVWRMTDPAALPHAPQHLCIQLDATATRRLTRPVRMYVDYVRILA
jgi:beta-glucanase (GH16 family)